MTLRICILGSGSIGTYYGAKLAHRGSDVHFLIRGDLSQVRRDGIFVRGEGENFQVANINCYNSTNEIGPCDLVIISVKATSNSDVLDLIPPLLHEKTMLLILQNGLGSEDLFAQHFGAERVLGGLSVIAVDRHSKTEVERYAYGEVILGEFGRPPQPRTHCVAEEFVRAGVKCRVADDLMRERWRKLIWNIPFNGLSIVAGGIDTAAILADKYFRELTLGLMKEIIAAANTLGFDLPADAWRKHIERTEQMSAGYKPSTLQDWEGGKPLEIEAIWGEPVRRARAAGAEMPRTEMIYELLRHMDRMRRS
ncbi:MAG TPA: 2-dehydropantoate 2-reductase [Chthoniobacterales bacterium]|nr:2-dehydropantoate 2-reductase [Chthoniobacterales bacterium]